MADRAAAKIGIAIEPIPAFLISAGPPVEDDIRGYSGFRKKTFVIRHHFRLEKYFENPFCHFPAMGAGEALPECLSGHCIFIVLCSEIRLQLPHCLFKHIRILIRTAFKNKATFSGWFRNRPLRAILQMRYLSGAWSRLIPAASPRRTGLRIRPSPKPCLAWSGRSRLLRRLRLWDILRWRSSCCSAAFVLRDWFTASGKKGPCRTAVMRFEIWPSGIHFSLRCFCGPARVTYVAAGCFSFLFTHHGLVGGASVPRSG